LLPDGGSVPSISEAGGLQAVERLFEEAGPLTVLEIFHALAGTEAEPNPLLVRHHAVEADLLGRPDAAVREILFDPRVIAKVSPSTCDGFIVGNYWRHKAKKDYASGRDYVCLKNDCGFWTTEGTKAVICANSTEVDARAGIDLGNGWEGDWGQVPLNQPFWHYVPSGPWRRFAADGDSTGAQYHLRVAALYQKGAS
jgi:hypothetical protein